MEWEEALLGAWGGEMPTQSSAYYGDVEATLGEEFLDVSIAQCETQDPNRVLDDHRRKAVAAIRDFSHRASLPAVSLPSHRLS
jgi:hypothetical protein